MPTASLGRSRRLAGRRNFEQVFRRGKTVREGWLSLCWFPNGLPESRLGCAVGRGVGNAVRRNRLKRWVRETFRKNRAAIPAGLDLVVRARDLPAETIYPLVEEKLLSLCRKIASRSE